MYETRRTVVLAGGVWIASRSGDGTDSPRSLSICSRYTASLSVGHRPGFPRAASGALAGRDDRTWRTSVVTNERLARLGGQQVRLEILDTTKPDRALVTVDVVLPEPAWAQAPETEPDARAHE